MDDFTLPVRTLLAAAATWMPCAAQDDRAAALAEHAVSLRTIDAQDHDFTDLKPLIDAIGNARIVVLGEATHSEGTAAAAKARLAIFLHQRMGFDVLAWEAGVLDCAAMDRAMRDPKITPAAAAQRMMRGGWDSLEQTQALFEYASATWQTARPLRMAGFDGERPPHGSRHFAEALAELSKAGALDLTDQMEHQLEKFADRAFGYIRSDSKPATDAERAAQLDAVHGVLETLDRPETTRRMSPTLLGRIRAAIHQGLASEERKQNSATQNWDVVEHPRDPTMARSFRWLADHEFAGKRIIVWAATAHLTRNTKTLEPVEANFDYSEAEHMGDTVARDYGSDLYTIAVTSYHGTLGRVSAEGDGRTSPLEPAPAGSFDALAHAANQPYLFVDLRGAPQGSWLAGPFVARPLGYIPTRAVWKDVIDAFLFIDRAEPERSR